MSDRVVHPQVLHTDMYETVTEEPDTVDEPDEWCNNGGDEGMDSLDASDKNRMVRYLKDISVTFGEYIHGRITRQEALKIIKRKYSYYRCTLKEDMVSATKKTKLIKSFFNIGLMLFCFAITVFALSQIWKKLRNTGAIISLISSLIYICVFNPFYSVFTITSEYIGHVGSSSIVEHRGQIHLISSMELGLEAIITAELKNMDSIKLWCKTYFSPEEGDSTVSSVSSDPLTLKYEKLERISQFFKNQKKFILKSTNPIIAIKHNDQLDECLRFLTGEGDIDSILRENMNTTDDTENIIYDTTTQIRANAFKILKHIEGYAFYRTLNMLGYNEDTPDAFNLYFVERLNTLLTEFHNSTTDDTRITVFIDIREILVRLYRLGLPEYYFLRNLLFNDKGSKRFEQGGNDKYPILNKSQTKIKSEYIADITAIRANVKIYMNSSSTMINSVTLDVPGVGVPVSLDPSVSLDPPVVSPGDEEEPVSDILAYYELQDKLYLELDSIVFTKSKSFIGELSIRRLPADFKTNNSVSVDLINDSIMNYAEGISSEPKMVIDYIINRVKKLDTFRGDQNTFNIFSFNVRKLISTAYISHEGLKKNSELFFMPDNEIESPHKYITFEAFNIKLLDVKKDQLKQYVKHISDTKDDLEFFMDNIENSETKNEDDVLTNALYSKYIIMFCIISGLLVFDTIFQLNFGGSIDDVLIDMATNSGVDAYVVEDYSVYTKTSLYFCVWVLAITILNTHSVNKKTRDSYNHLTTRKNTESLRRQLNRFYLKVELYYSDVVLESDSPDTAVVGKTKKMKEVYFEMNKLIEMYEKCNHIKNETTTSNFPISNIAVSIVLLLVLGCIIYVTVKSRPQIIRKSSTTPGIQKGGWVGVGGNVKKTKAQNDFDHMTLSFSIFIFSIYIALQIFTSSIRMRNNLNSGTLYYNNKCI
jgi:hypothetical protein|tara:strand:- start:575 stop:3364 length:2790 start_codon:yes stop_codon:yes gene_type:complete